MQATRDFSHYLKSAGAGLLHLDLAGRLVAAQPGGVSAGGWAVIVVGFVVIVERFVERGQQVRWQHRFDFLLG